VNKIEQRLKAALEGIVERAEVGIMQTKTLTAVTQMAKGALDIYNQHLQPRYRAY